MKFVAFSRSVKGKKMVRVKSDLHNRIKVFQGLGKTFEWVLPFYSDESTNEQDRSCPWNECKIF